MPSFDLNLNNPGNSNSEGKRKTVRVNGVDCKIQFAILKIDIYWFFSTSVYFSVQCNFKLISSETVIWFGICMIGVICSLNQLKSNWCMSSVDQSVVSLEKELTKRKANGIESKWSYKNQNSTYMGKLQWNFDQGKWNLLQFFVLFLTKWILCCLSHTKPTLTQPLCVCN